MITTSGIGEEFIPCLGTVLRVLVNHRLIWLKYLPGAVGCFWSVYFIRKHLDVWNWLRHGSVLVLVSLLVAPYEWFTDTAVALPAVLAAVYVCRSRMLLGVLALASAAIELQAVYGVSFHSKMYLWPAPVWLVWYLFAMKSADQADLDPETTRENVTYHEPYSANFEGCLPR